MINTTLSSSSDNLPFKFCSNHKFSHVDSFITILTCVINGLSAPVAVAGNSLILAAIWRNRSLRTPSYMFLGGLALTDFCIGIVGQPFYVLYRVAALKTLKRLYCVSSAIAHSIVPYLVVLTGSTITAMAVERWLVMSRRSFLTVRRVYVVETCLLVLPIPYMALRRLPGMDEYFDIPIVSMMEGALGFSCFVISALAYYKVYRIIRHHQQQIHANTTDARRSVINLEKYKRSVYSILWIFALFLLSYAPYVSSSVFLKVLNASSETSVRVLHLATSIMLLSSSLNPFLYIWRLRDIRKEAKKVVRKVLCKGT